MANFYVVILLLERSQFLPEQFSGKAAKLLTVKGKKKQEPRREVQPGARWRRGGTATRRRQAITLQIYLRLLRGDGHILVF